MAARLVAKISFGKIPLCPRDIDPVCKPLALTGFFRDFPGFPVFFSIAFCVGLLCVLLEKSGASLGTPVAQSVWGACGGIPDEGNMRETCRRGLRETCGKNVGGDCGENAGNMRAGIAGKDAGTMREQYGENAGNMREICGTAFF